MLLNEKGGKLSKKEISHPGQRITAARGVLDPSFERILEIHFYEGVRKVSDELNAKKDAKMIKAVFSSENMTVGVGKE